MEKLSNSIECIPTRLLDVIPASESEPYIHSTVELNYVHGQMYIQMLQLYLRWVSGVFFSRKGRRGGWKRRVGGVIQACQDREIRGESLELVI